MKIALGNDHAGFELKKRLMGLLAGLGHECVDKGAHSVQACDYPDYARAAAEAVAGGECGLGILVCGTGIGMCMAANKVPGIRAAKACSEQEARMSRLHNDANVLCLGARTMDYETGVKPVVEAWLSTGFEGGRHERRVRKIAELERLGRG